MAQITLDLDDETRIAVVRALHNHAAYMRGYRNNSLIAQQLEDVALQIQEVSAEAHCWICSEVERDNTQLRVAACSELNRAKA